MFEQELPKCKAWENHSCQGIGDLCSSCIITAIRSAGFERIYFTDHLDKTNSANGDYV